MKTVLITGGSKGIGLEFAKHYANQKCNLILVARNKETLNVAAKQLQQDYGVSVTTIEKDLSVPGSALALFQEIPQDVDIVINNAGFGMAGRAIENDIEKEEALVQLNDASLMTLSKLFVKRWMGKKTGTLINVASTGAFQPGPYIASYYASKSFVVSYTRALAYEVKGSGIQVYCYCPGPVDTDFYPTSKGKKPSSAISPEKAVQQCIYAMKPGHVMIVPGLVSFLSQWVPSSWKMWIIAKMKKPKGQ